MRTPASNLVRPVVHMYRHNVSSPVGPFFLYTNTKGEVCCANWTENETHAVESLTDRFFKSCDIVFHREADAKAAPGSEAARLLQAYFDYHGATGTPQPTVFCSLADSKQSAASSRKRQRDEATQQVVSSLRSLHAQHTEMEALLGKIPVAFAPDVSEFQRKVWHALHTRVPSGTITTYKALANLAVEKDVSSGGGAGSCARAVGTAMHDNPICVVVPCHRVLASNGGMNGYGCGLYRKVWLLRHEGAQDVDEAKLRRVEKETLVSTPQSRR